eukprot:scaffold4996_cov62-Isochrysis_galbana.AAC.1
MTWHDQGHFLCVKVDKHSKSKRTLNSAFELFRLRDKGVPIEVGTRARAISPQSHRNLTAISPQSHRNLTARSPQSGREVAAISLHPAVSPPRYPAR